MISTSTSSQIPKCKSPSFQQLHPILVTKIPRYKRRDLPLSFLAHTTSGCKCYRYRSPAQRLPEWPSKTITPFSWASAKEVLGNRKHCEDKPLLVLKCDRLGTLTNYSLTSRCLKFDVGDWQVVSTTCLNTVPPQTATEQSCKAKIGAEAIFLHFLQNMQMGPLPLQFWSAGQICVVLVPLPRCSASERTFSTFPKDDYTLTEIPMCWFKASVSFRQTNEYFGKTSAHHDVQCPGNVCCLPTSASGPLLSHAPQAWWSNQTQLELIYLRSPSPIQRPRRIAITYPIQRIFEGHLVWTVDIPPPCRRSQSCWCRLTSSFSWTS